MSAAVRDGIYLEGNAPARSQFRVGRRDPVKPVIVVHTAESGTDRSGPDPKAEAVASFIQRRSDPGSYHLIGDADSIIQLIRFDNEAFHDHTGSNRWSIGISLAMNAADWGTIPAARRDELIGTAGQMAAIAARWLQDRGLEPPAPQLLTKAESDRPDASGFISHARRDPGRRSDPGAGFPWPLFFTAYAYHLEGDPTTMPTTDPNELVMSHQQELADAGYDPGPLDGIYGPRTRAADRAVMQDLNEANFAPGTVAKSAAADALADAYRDLMEATS